MKLVRLFIVSLALASSMFAASKSGMFANVSSNEIHKVQMATKMTFMFQKDGHPVTIFLNDKGVMVADKTRKEYAKAQDNLAKFIAKGGKVLICPMCLKHYAIDPKDLIDGAMVANHQAVENALFAPNTTALSW
jgi:predicted peroxiredoxin